jgi:superfamily II DNA or RNA helicase
MAAKYRSSSHVSVRTPEARMALQRWLDDRPEHLAERGNDYFDEGRVAAAWAGADHFVEAEVVGGDRYLVTLFLTRGKWTTSCTCPVGADCKHAIAAALAWIAHDGTDFEAVAPATPAGPEPVAPAAPALPSPPPVFPPATSPAGKVSFRDKWGPVLAEKLGRLLLEDERRMLGQLSALFAEFANCRCLLYPHALRVHGFGDAVPPRADPFRPLFDGWWPRSSPPSDPWQLWQYIAFSLERNGQPVPEAFRPLTDTSAVSAAMEELQLKEAAEEWRRVLIAPQLSPPESPERWQSDVSSLRARINEEGQVFIEARSAPDKPWKAPSQRWAAALRTAMPDDFMALTPAEAALAMTLAMARREGTDLPFKRPLPVPLVAAILGARSASTAVVLPDERAFAIEAEPLAPEASLAEATNDRLLVRLVAPDGADASAARLITREPEPLYLFAGRVWRGPPPLPPRPLPIAALGDAALMTRLRRVGLRLPASLEKKHRVVRLRPKLRMWLADSTDPYSPQYFCVQLSAGASDPPCEQHWCGVGGWQWTKGGAPPLRRPDDPILEFDLSQAQAVSARFAEFRLGWADWYQAWTRPVTKSFPDEILAWRATLPPDVDVEASTDLAAFFAPPLRATMDFSARPTDSSHDWFDVTVALRIGDTQLTSEEVALLLKAKGKWVRLPKHGWRRLELDAAAMDAATSSTLDRLGLTAADVLASGRTATHRVHALQLAAEAAALEARDAALAQGLRERLATLAAMAPAEIPGSLSATLRPYQREGFQFLAHLSSLGFGGVLADDMGLGKTVQSLAWLLHLRSKCRRGAFRALVVCPKSVMHGWLGEASRFAPDLAADVFVPAMTARKAAKVPLLVANYTQLRLQAAWFCGIEWNAVILDEGQFIKNPASQIAEVARNLKARERLVLTGTPVENRLTDLWSLFAFAQPGLLGTATAFRRQYDEKDPAALERLHRRVRHFLLRRTKAQAAPDLPPRTEDEITVDLEPAQRKLYDAELKRARQQLLGIDSDRALDKVRFNVLSSLLRLRQICCHPALLDPAHAATPSAKLEALLERLEELRDEGHQVLVFSQFVEMLELIRGRLVDAGIGHLLLTGATENRAELVARFQEDRANTVFLLSLKAAGFGLNLTAASYVILYDPWWNPAVEAQAIDRTHRIGQTRPVIAYRLLACDTVEQKIRQLQQEKAALAAAVVQEESLARVLDLESLRRILS